MCEVEFQYNGKKTIIQCVENNKMKNIISNFVGKANLDKDSLYFSYNGKAGKEFDEELTFSQIANSFDRNQKKMVVLAYDLMDKESNNQTISKSNNVICPSCGENIKLSIKNYKISLFDCKNGHKINNLSLKAFEESQKIDNSKIICGKCKEKKNTSKNQFYKCLECNQFLCYLCHENHEQNHSIIEYDKISYLCQKDNDYYSKYCKKCKKNICMLCENEHKYHDMVYFADIISNKKELQKKLNELKTYIDKFNEAFFEINKIINEVKENINLYYKIKKDIINAYDTKNKNYELLVNLKEISNNNDIIGDINQVINQKNIINKFNSILNIYNNKKTNIEDNNWKLEKEKLNREINDLEDKIEGLKEEIEDLKEENENLKEENENLKEENENLKSPSKHKDNDIDNYEKMKKKLELIGKVIDMGNDPNSKISKYNYGNKFLVIELIHTNMIQTEKVAKIMLDVDRNNYAPRNQYVNKPQYIGYNVTISAPHMHAFALEHLSNFCTKDAHILDVGSGSGFLTVALSKMANDTGTVVGIEHIPELYNFGITNVKKNHGNLLQNGKIIFIKGDGREGYKKCAPYKAIHVGAASEKIPIALTEQLACNGRMFIPIGKKGETQNIYLVDKDSNGDVTFKSILPVCYGMLTDVESQLNPEDD